MEIFLAPEQETQLNQLAVNTGRGTDDLVQEAIGRLLSENHLFVEQIQVGLKDLNEGRLLEDEAVRSRIDRLFQSE